MGDRAWQVPRDQFVAVWNGAASLDDAAARLKELTGGNVPRWALMARAMELRRDGLELKALVRTDPARASDPR
jgi:hypothetical protein